jgi:putative aldouronate transport system substrate-binding protein
VAIPVGVADPTLGYQSATLDSKGAPLGRTLTDAVTDLLAGRRPMSEWEQVVKDWQNGGGNMIRTELEKAIAADAG